MEQQNKYRVIVSARAAQMLVSHAAFLAQVSPAAAERLTVEFEKAAKSLEQMPQRCPWLRGECPNSRSSRRRSLKLHSVSGKIALPTQRKKPNTMFLFVPVDRHCFPITFTAATVVQGSP